MSRDAVRVVSDPIIIALISAGVSSLTPSLAGESTGAEDRHFIGEFHHFAEFVRDHQDRQITGDGACLSIVSSSSASPGVSTLVGSSRNSTLFFR